MNKTGRPDARILLIVLIGSRLLTTSAHGAAAPTEPGGPDYIPDAGYYLLMAEIAVQRKEFLTAAEEYSNAAGQSADPKIARRATEFTFEYGYDAFAMNGVRRWLTLDPDSPLAHEYAGRLHFRRNELDLALHHIRMALGPVSERSDEDYFALGTDLAEEENAVGATTLLTRLTVEAPDSAALRMTLAQAAYRSGAYELALGSARRAAQSDPDWIQPQILIARALLFSGDEYQALEQMEALVAGTPVFGIELEYVRLLASSDRNSKAMQMLRDLAKKYGAQAELIRMHGLLSLSMEDLDIAERDFRELVQRGDNLYESLYYLGQVATLRADHREAIRILRRIRGGGYLVPAQLNIVRAYSELGQEQAGIDHLQRFSADYPRYAVDMLEPQAQLLHRMDRSDAALQTYDRMIRFKPRSVDLVIARAMLLEESGRLDEAMREMREAVEIAPTNATALNTLGYTLANRTRRYAESYRLIRLALEIAPNSPAIIDSMGWVLYRRGRLEEARSYLELAYSLLEDPELVAHLGEVYWVTGERDRATELWTAALESYPDSQPLIEATRKYLQ